MVPGRRSVKESAVQGGLLVIRPNLATFELYKEILMEGDYDPETGWGNSKGLKFGGFYGAAQIQGLCSYFFGHVRPETAVELNRCNINSMVDSPYANEKGHEGKCREPIKCEDCRLTNMSDILAVHYTVCRKPWKCNDNTAKEKEIRRLCGAFHNEWFLYRHEMETAWANRVGVYNTTAVRLGREWVPGEGQKTFCDGKGPDMYTPILYPDQSDKGPFLHK